MMNLNSIQEFLRVEGGNIILDGIDITELAGETPTPFYIYSKSVVKRNIDNLKSILSGIDGEYKIFYAMKAFSDSRILKIVRNLGLGVEVVSLGELRKAYEVGFTPKDIVYNGIGKTPTLLKAFSSVGYAGINLDSEYEFKLARELGMLNSDYIGVRVNVEVRKRVLDTSSSTSKFGLEPRKLYKLIDEYHINRLGLHIHLGSQISDPKLLRELLKRLTDIVDRLAGEYGVDINYLDIGGGIPKDYIWTPIKTGLKDLDIKFFRPGYTLREYRSFLKSIRKMVGKDIPIYLEPGRFLVGDAGMLITRIIGYKERLDGTRWLYIDTGFIHLLSGLLYRWYFPIINISRLDEVHDTGYRLAGILCDSDDIFHDYEGEKHGISRLPPYKYLPSSTTVGDIMMFLHVGAYNYEEVSTYNSIEKPPVIFI